MNSNDSKIEDLRRVTIIGLWVNLTISILKLVTGFLIGSQALIADGWHSFSDCWSDLAILIASRYWEAPADECHPHGHRRIEVAVTAMIGLGLGGIATVILYNGLISLRGGDLRQTSQIGTIVILVSLIAKESLYHFTIWHAKRIKSEVLRANAWHHRSDVLSSLPVFLALLIGNFDASWRFLDPLAALFVVLFLYKASYEIAEPAIQKLLDKGAPPYLVNKIKTEIMTLSEIKGVNNIRTRYVGNSEISVEIDIEVDGSFTVLRGHELANAARDRIKQQIQDVVDVVVHVDPWINKQNGSPDPELPSQN